MIITKDNPNSRAWFRKPDLLCIIFLAAVALCWYGWQLTAARSVSALTYAVMVDGVIAAEGLLRADGADLEFSVEQRPGVIFHIQNGAIAFLSSDCPDKICVRMGYIHNSGQTAACLPNGVIVQVRGTGVSNGEPDAVVWVNP